MKTRRAVLWRIGLVGLPVAALVLFSMDESPPNDSDLRIQWAAIPEGENAYTYYAQAIEKLDLFKEDKRMTDLEFDKEPPKPAVVPAAVKPEPARGDQSEQRKDDDGKVAASEPGE